MGCNCGSKNGNFKYVYTAPDGSKKVYKTEIEANAAKIRGGNKGRVDRQPA